MHDIIQLLPESIANQIAAGEVVQRPASVVKELLENAIDAGADQIQLHVRDAGTTYIQVIDNGSGMSETDARMCWERHATSKIRKAMDLFHIQTFGFRGEALASIASVAQVELKTKRTDDHLGTRIQIEQGTVITQEPAQCLQGTSITVKNLFFNIPARKNFLKSPSIESKHIFDEFTRVALPNPQIAFSFFNNQQEVIRLEKSDARTRICELLGKKDKGELIELREDTDIVQIHGHVGSPEYARRVRGDQFFFVNGRYIREPYFHHAVQSAFEGLIPDDHFPFYVLFLEIDPSKIDVNVHPTKTEIKFEDSKSIYSILKSVVKKALGSYTITPVIEDNAIFDFSALKSPAGNDLIRQFNTPVSKTGFNPFEGEPRANPRQDWGKVLDPFKRPETGFDTKPFQMPEPEKESERVLFDDPLKASLEGLFSLPGGFIACQMNRELYIIRQRPAMEKVLYEQFRKQMSDHKIPVQTLLFPRIAEFNAADYQLVYSLMDEIRQLGFDMSPYGSNTFIINGVPSINDKGDPQNVLEGLIENYKLNEQSLHLDKKENLTRSMAGNVARKASEHLGQQEMEDLILQLFRCEQPGFLPDGQPVFIKLSRERLGDFFSR